MTKPRGSSRAVMGRASPIRTLDRESETLEQERALLVAAIASGGQLDAPLGALEDREGRLATLPTRHGRARAHSAPYTPSTRPRCVGICASSPARGVRCSWTIGRDLPRDPRWPYRVLETSWRRGGSPKERSMARTTLTGGEAGIRTLRRSLALVRPHVIGASVAVRVTPSPPDSSADRKDA